jgi:hypothetical protein
LSNSSPLALGLWENEFEQSSNSNLSSLNSSNSYSSNSYLSNSNLSNSNLSNSNSSNSNSSSSNSSNSNSSNLESLAITSGQAKVIVCVWDNYFWVTFDHFLKQEVCLKFGGSVVKIGSRLKIFHHYKVYPG